MPPYNPAFETWQVIPWYPDYDCSTWGRIASYKVCGRAGGAEPKVIRPTVREHGYLNVNLVGSDGLRKGLRVSRLVLETFIGPCPEGMEARHFPDPTPSNNRLVNLSWATKSDNEWDKVARERADLTEAKVVEILGLVLSGRKPAYVALQFGIENYVVTDILAGRYGKHLGLGSKASVLTIKQA